MRKNAKKIIELKCKCCQKSFNQPKKEYDRQTKRGRTNFYCSRSCAAMKNESLIKNKNFAKENPDFISKALIEFKNKYPNKKWTRVDEFTPFKYFIRKAKTRNKEKGSLLTNLSVQYLKKLFEFQKGICPYTGIKMELRDTTNNLHLKKSIIQASLDRTDSSQGYIEGNVEFVCLGVNYAKNGFSKQETMDFFAPMRNKMNYSF